jgi:hypothetical protein
MRAARPRAARAPGARAAAAAALALALLLAPAAARAGNDLGLAVDAVETVGGAVCVSYHVAEPFTPKLRETLGKGMPAHVVYEVGVWRKRSFWFPKLVVAITSEHKVVYDDARGRYRVRSGTNPPRSYEVPGLDSLQSRLFVRERLPLVPASDLDSSAGYYVSVRVLIRPLSPEDLSEVEDWLAGGAEPGLGGRRGIPDYLLGLAVSLSGLGDRTALVKSGKFRPAELAEAGGPAGPYR